MKTEVKRKLLKSVCAKSACGGVVFHEHHFYALKKEYHTSAPELMLKLSAHAEVLEEHEKEKGVDIVKKQLDAENREAKFMEKEIEVYDNGDHLSGFEDALKGCELKGVLNHYLFSAENIKKLAAFKNYVSDDAKKGPLQGIRFSAENQEIVATDGHALFLKSVDPDYPIPDGCSFTLPTSALPIIEMLPHVHKVSVYERKRVPEYEATDEDEDNEDGDDESPKAVNNEPVTDAVYVVFEGAEFMSEVCTLIVAALLSEGRNNTYPDYIKVVPDSKDCVPVEVSRETVDEWIDTLKRIKPPKEHHVVIKNNAFVFDRNYYVSDKCNTMIVLNSAITPPNLFCGANPARLLHVLQDIRGELPPGGNVKFTLYYKLFQESGHCLMLKCAVNTYKAYRTLLLMATRLDDKSERLFSEKRKGEIIAEEATQTETANLTDETEADDDILG